MRTHTCETCGHEVKHNGDLEGAIEHLPNGGHRWSTSVPVALKLNVTPPQLPTIWAGQELPTHLDA